MKILFAMILLMFVSVQGCATAEEPTMEQVADGSIATDSTSDEMDAADSVDEEVSLDEADVVPTVDVETGD
tara:strand:- start:141 stop:353 length:213 start_codon:yes stop_codon:yes gene_type:complete